MSAKTLATQTEYVALALVGVPDEERTAVVYLKDVVGDTPDEVGNPVELSLFHDVPLGWDDG